MDQPHTTLMCLQGTSSQFLSSNLAEDLAFEALYADPDTVKHNRDRFNVKIFVKERVVKTACEAWTNVVNQNN